MKILVLNKNDFNQLMVDNNITIIDNNLYIISINDTEGDKSISYFEDVESDNLLKLYFDDTTEDVVLKDVTYTTNINIKRLKKNELKVMNEQQGKNIISFLDKIEGDYTLIIHCTAGQNRSGSVGKFAADYLEYGQEKLMKENSYIKGNAEVTRILNRLWLWSHYE